MGSPPDAGADAAEEPDVSGPGLASPADGPVGVESGPEAGSDTGSDTSSGCSDRCQLGDKRCGEGGLEECIDSGCAIWGPATPCPAPTMCQPGGTSATCGCPEPCPLGGTSCGERGVRDCIVQNGCRVWGSERTCPSFCKQTDLGASCCGDGVRGPDEVCDDGVVSATDLGSCNPECTGFYQKKLIRETSALYTGDLGGAAGADRFCQEELGSGWKALIVGGGRRATVTPLQGDGQIDWVISKYTHYYNASDQLLWRTDETPLLGVSNGQRMNTYAPAFFNFSYPWGGYDSSWVEVTRNDTIGQLAGTCLGWSTTDRQENGTFPFPDLTIGDQEPCSELQPLLCVQQ
jgi:hypothetical protein